jgi:hypothetical protein
MENMINDVKVDIKLHPKLQIAVDRINKRYADVIVARHKTRLCSVDYERKEFITYLELKTNVSSSIFAKLEVTATDDTYDSHKFNVSSRLVKNERRPRDTKTTTKANLIPKLIDQYCRPFTLTERSDELLSEGRHRLQDARWKAENVMKEAYRTVIDRCFDLMTQKVMGETDAGWTDEQRQSIVAHREAREKYAWVKKNADYDGGAVQVIAFQVGEKWVINIYNSKRKEDGTANNIVENYDSFEALPDYIQQKVALLRIAPHNEVLDDIGVKVEANSYFLYGHELQHLKGTNDTGEKGKAEGNETA